MTESVDVLQALKEDEYKWGDLQAVRYDPKRTDLFADTFLAYLYARCRESKRRSGNGILDACFGGNPASNFNAIVTYLAQRPVLLILGKWIDGKFNELGFAFPTVSVGTDKTEKSLIVGYAFFKSAWGTEDQRIVTLLGLAYFFKEFGLSAIIGNRFPENVLTAKFMARFGFKDYGQIPRFQLQGSKLVPMVVSALMREDFEELVKEWLVEQYRAEHGPEIPRGVPSYLHEEYRESVRNGKPIEPIPAIVEHDPPAEIPAAKPEEPYLPLNWL
jgi:RimJ/RimL family protein N-acetyltransferase